jgi:hypothetical protein
MYSIHLAQDTVHMWAHVNMAVNLQVKKSAWNFLASWVTQSSQVFCVIRISNSCMSGFSAFPNREKF